jgi:hypothetical protein
MGWLSDNLDFEKFHLSDMWDRLKDDPKRLLLGVDPFSTSIWNTALGRDDDPIMNQLGGPMGGDYLGIGSGGVYDRAQEAGVNTGPAMQMHDLAETVAAFYGAGGAARGLGNIGGSGGGIVAGEGGGGILGGESGGILGGGGGASGGGGIGGGATGGTAPAGGGSGSGGMFDFGSMDWGNPQTYMDLMQMMPQGGQQQQQQPQGPPPMRLPQGPGGISQPGGMYGHAAPANREALLGLLASVDDDELQKVLGGLL